MGKAEERSLLYKNFARSIWRFPSPTWLLQLLAVDLHLIQTVHSFIFSFAFPQFDPHIIRITNYTLRNTTEQKWIYLTGALVQSTVEEQF